MQGPTLVIAARYGGPYVGGRANVDVVDRLALVSKNTSLSEHTTGRVAPTLSGSVEDAPESRTQLKSQPIRLASEDLLWFGQPTL